MRTNFNNASKENEFLNNKSQELSEQNLKLNTLLLTSNTKYEEFQIEKSQLEQKHDKIQNQFNQSEVLNSSLKDAISNLKSEIINISEIAQQKAESEKIKYIELEVAKKNIEILEAKHQATLVNFHYFYLLD